MAEKFRHAWSSCSTQWTRIQYLFEHLHSLACHYVRKAMPEGSVAEAARPPVPHAALQTLDCVLGPLSPSLALPSWLTWSGRVHRG